MTRVPHVFMRWYDRRLFVACCGRKVEHKYATVDGDWHEGDCKRCGEVIDKNCRNAKRKV